MSDSTKTEKSCVFCSFVTRCYDDALADKTIDEVREIYSNYSNPSCTKYRGNGPFASGYSNDTGQCDRWIYKLDHGYKSMSSEVSQLTN